MCGSENATWNLFFALFYYQKGRIVQFDLGQNPFRLLSQIQFTTFLLSLGVSVPDLRRIFPMCPGLLTSSTVICSASFLLCDRAECSILHMIFRALLRFPLQFSSLQLRREEQNKERMKMVESSKEEDEFPSMESVTPPSKIDTVYQSKTGKVRG